MAIKCIQVKDFNESIHTQLSKPSKYGCDACVADSCPTCVKKKIPCSCWDRPFQLEDGSTQIIGIPNKLNISVSCCVKCSGGDGCCAEGEKCLSLSGKSVCCPSGQQCGDSLCCPEGNICRQGTGFGWECCAPDCCDGCCYCTASAEPSPCDPETFDAWCKGEGGEGGGGPAGCSCTITKRVDCELARQDPLAACASVGLWGSKISEGSCCGSTCAPNGKCSSSTS